jgi:hypothetical protein
MALHIPLGTSDFRLLRQKGLSYVDKTRLIRDLIDDPSLVLLLPRPRRFGKTLNLSMLNYFFARGQEDTWPLFADLAIAAAGPGYRAHHRRYPTIWFTCKDIKARTWQDCRAALADLIAEQYRQHRALLDEGFLDSSEAAGYAAILERRADNATLWASLRFLSAALHRRYGEQVLILVDEYDTPIHAGLSAGYYDDVIEFFRNFLSGGLKDNSALYKGVLTGVLRVAKDSVFTGLNNITVHSLFSTHYATAFGFTQPEVESLLEQAGMSDRLAEVQRWYNGYLFGGQVIYNPWSVLSYLMYRPQVPQPYWAETSSNDLVRDLLLGQGGGLRQDWERLLSGQAIEQPVRDSVALRELRDQPDLLWSILLFTGYLKLLGLRLDEESTLLGTLALPNEEVRQIYRGQFRTWLDQGLGGDAERRGFLAALLAGDAERVERYLAALLMRHASFHDTALPQPERFYHGLVLGLLVSLGKDYEVRSNSETGYGRCDLLIAPRQPGRAGVVLEFKVADERRRETLAAALKAAQRQLIERDYGAALLQAGASAVHQLAVAWSGKDVRVVVVKARQAPRARPPRAGAKAPRAQVKSRPKPKKAPAGKAGRAGGSPSGRSRGR